jgi:hypothetical protein
MWRYSNIVRKINKISLENREELLGKVCQLGKENHLFNLENKGVTDRQKVMHNQRQAPVGLLRSNIIQQTRETQFQRLPVTLTNLEYTLG